MAVLAALSKEIPWFDRTIEVVISTHPDRDHLEGLLHVLERYRVRLVLLPRVSHPSQLYGEWLQKLRPGSASELTYRFASRGQRLRAGNVEASLLGPGRSALALARSGRTNNASVITRVDLEGLPVLLTGDAERSAEKILIEETSADKLDVIVLKAGHHGSKTSSSPLFVGLVDPSYTVFSRGCDNTYGFPHQETIDTFARFGIPTLDTCEEGTITFRSDGTKVWRE